MALSLRDLPYEEGLQRLNLPMLTQRSEKRFDSSVQNDEWIRKSGETIIWYEKQEILRGHGKNLKVVYRRYKKHSYPQR